PISQRAFPDLSASFLVIALAKRKPEHRALPDARLRPDAPAVALDDAAGDRQPDACAFELILAMQALERAEQFADVAHVEPHAVVANENALLQLVAPAQRLSLCPEPAGADLDHRAHARTRVLQGVADQADEHPKHQRAVTVDGGQFADAPLNVSAGAQRLELGDRLLHQVAERGELAVQLHLGETRQVEKSVDQRAHLLGAALNLIEVDLRLARVRRAAVFPQHLNVCVDQPQRRPQIVRNRVSEIVDLPPRSLQFRRTPPETFLERGAACVGGGFRLPLRRIDYLTLAFRRLRLVGHRDLASSYRPPPHPPQQGRTKHVRAAGEAGSW